jgi:hypothetical protein
VEWISHNPGQADLRADAERFWTTAAPNRSWCGSAGAAPIYLRTADGFWLRVGDAGSTTTADASNNPPDDASRHTTDDAICAPSAGNATNADITFNGTAAAADDDTFSTNSDAPVCDYSGIAISGRACGNSIGKSNEYSKATGFDAL